MAQLLTLAILQGRWPHGDQHIPGLMEGIVASAPAVFEKYGISGAKNPPLLVAHMMATSARNAGKASK